MPSTREDSNFASSIMDVALSNNACKDQLVAAATKLREIVIEPLLNKLRAGTDLETYEKQALEFIIGEHTKENAQYGAAMPDIPKNSVSGNNERSIELLEILNKRMREESIRGISNKEQLAGVMKAITDACFTYVEKFPIQKKGAEFENIKSMITPTPQELNIRILRKELEQEDQIATTFGIGTEAGKDIAPVDAIPVDAERQHKAGKSVFAKADVHERAKLTIGKYDTQFALVESLKLKGTDTSELEAAQKSLTELGKAMKLLGVNTDPTRRGDTPVPFIQQLAKAGGTAESPLPLVATASGTTARTLITLHDLGVFNTPEGHFDRESAQYMSTLLCGSIVHGGHHSVLEVAEMYNRLLDHEAIKESLIGVNIGETERGYYALGDSGTLVPDAMRGAVLSTYQAKERAAVQADMKKLVEELRSSEGAELVMKPELKPMESDDLYSAGEASDPRGISPAR